MVPLGDELSTWDPVLALKKPALCGAQAMNPVERVSFQIQEMALCCGATTILRLPQVSGSLKVTPDVSAAAELLKQLWTPFSFTS
ncbi:hypothetical protein HBH92_097860 [Parastagonospora nodorum]|nr:hypothetical protein HBH92_097860 [Parastagonospora nodorum]